MSVMKPCSASHVDAPCNGCTLLFMRAVQHSPYGVFRNAKISVVQQAKSDFALALFFQP
jgi:hypothetical protein